MAEEITSTEAAPEVPEMEQKVESGMAEAEKELRLALGFEPDTTAAPAAENKDEAKSEEPATPDATEVKPPETVEDDDPDLKDLPKDNPKSEHWRKLDKIARERKKELEAIKTKLAEMEKAQTPAPTVEPPPQTVPKPQEQTTETRYPAEDVMSLLAKIEDGAFEEKVSGQAESVKRDILDYISTKMSPKELKDVLVSANRGRFGLLSETVAKLAREFLPVAITTYQERENQQALQTKAETQRGESWGTVFKQFPDLQAQKKDSQDFKDYTESSKIVGNLFPGLWERPDAPAIVAEVMVLRRKAFAHDTVAKTVDALQKENAELRKRIGMSERPQTPNRNPASAAQGGKTNTAEDELRSNLSNLGLIR